MEQHAPSRHEPRQPGRVYVLGNAGVDFGLVLPRMPRPGESMVGSDPHYALGGKGLNQAVVAARAGARVSFMAPLGDDADADAVAAGLAAEPFEALALPRYALPTDRSVLMLTPDGENCIVSAGACAEGFEPASAARFAAAIQPGEWLLMQGNLSFAATHAAMTAGPAQVMFNTAPLLWDVRPLLPRCAIVVANRIEAEAITGTTSAAALHAAGSAFAVVTLGGDGCLVADRTGERYVPPCPARLLDSTGAGDAFCGALAAMVAAGVPADAAIAPAQRVAARTVEQRGAMHSFPSAAELTSLLLNTAHQT